jgi:hypothetical protein
MEVHKDTVERVVEILKTTFESGPFKEIYDGEPERIPKFNLPCLVVTLSNDANEPAQQGEDDVTEFVTVKVIFDKSDEVDKNDVKGYNSTERKIRKVIGERDPDTGRYLAKTVKGSVRQNLSAVNLVVAQRITTELGLQVRSDPKIEKPFITQEGHVTFQVDYSVDITEASGTS